MFEGERTLTRDNNKLGDFQLDGIPPAPRGVPQIEITYDIDANGILNVTAEDKSTNKKNNITITNDKGRLSKEDIEAMVQKAEEFAEEDEKLREKIEERNGLESYLYGVKNSINEEEFGKKLGDDKEAVEKLSQRWYLMVGRKSRC